MENEPRYQIATFAGGCFWCVESAFDHLDGVLSAFSGYMGGKKENPTYEEVSEGTTGHVECVQVVFDPKKISYAQLLDVYWHAIDPMQNNGQFCDIGPQYKPVIFYHHEKQKEMAEKSKKELSKIMQPVVVEILPASTFYPAEEYHQEYHKKNPLRYEYYRAHSGRNERFKQIWNK